LRFTEVAAAEGAANRARKVNDSSLRRLTGYDSVVYFSAKLEESARREAGFLLAAFRKQTN
jgi:hypothetical protein